MCFVETMDKVAMINLPHLELAYLCIQREGVKHHRAWKDCWSNKNIFLTLLLSTVIQSWNQDCIEYTIFFCLYRPDDKYCVSITVSISKLKNPAAYRWRWCVSPGCSRSASWRQSTTPQVWREHRWFWTTSSCRWRYWGSINFSSVPGLLKKKAWNFKFTQKFQCLMFKSEEATIHHT